MNDERERWRGRLADDELAGKLRGVAWVVSAVVLLLVGVMERVKVPLPAGWSLAFLPPIHAALNAAAGVGLVVALVCIRRGRVVWHRRAILLAMVLSVAFLALYVAYHLTTPATRYGGTGVLRTCYLLLLLSHIAAAAVSLPFILFTFISGWTNQFARHRRLARWVWPLWFYVTLTGPACYLMLRPYY